MNMKKTMISLVVLTTTLLATNAMARDYSYEIEKAQRSCSNQQGSLLRDRNGTPACDQVQDLIRLQQLETEAQVARETKQPMPSHTEINVNSNNYNNRVWSSVLGKYCYKNRWGHLDCSSN